MLGGLSRNLLLDMQLWLVTSCQANSIYVHLGIINLRYGHRSILR